MGNEVKRLIRVRSDKRARFKRDGAGKKPQISDSWRRPRGLHHKQRRQKKAKGALPRPGFGSPLLVRGLHPSGFREIRVFRTADLDGLDPAIHAIMIAGSVGGKNRAGIQEAAVRYGIRVLNAREIVLPAAKAEEEAGKDE
ncbi:MAG: 50S ribosomal protein L32e [Methanoregulaceae archaeon]|nr:50S ribosomal protein L32e [Methanoregulaceae archaeon]